MPYNTLFYSIDTVVDIANHRSGFGVTDDVVFVCGGEDRSRDIILATGFDIDQGCGFINGWWNRA